MGLRPHPAETQARPMLVASLETRPADQRPDLTRSVPMAFQLLLKRMVALETLLALVQRQETAPLQPVASLTLPQVSS